MTVSIIFTVSENDRISGVMYTANQFINHMDIYNALNYCLPVEIIIVMNGANNQQLLSKLEDYKRLSHVALKSVLFNDTQICVLPMPLDVVSARNRGVHLASGDWIVYIDAEQTIASNRFETLSVYIRDFYSKAKILFNSYFVHRILVPTTFQPVEYFPSIWRDNELSAIERGISISNFIGISHKRELGMSFDSELDFCKQMIAKKIPWAYCDISVGGLSERKLIDGNRNT